MENKSITLPLVKQEMNLALTEHEYNIQLLTNEIDSIIPNEDALQLMADAIKKLKDIDKVIADKHEELKKPHLEAGKIVDKAKNEMLTITGDLRNKIQPKYIKLCQDIAERKKQQEAEDLRVKTVTDKIENDISGYTTRIANATELEDLLNIERAINLSKASPAYQEFKQSFIDKANNVLIPLLTDQKNLIRQLDLLNKEKPTDERETVELEDKRDEIRASINQNAITVQERIVKAAPLSETIVKANPILPDVKARRKTWKFEVTDIALLAKKMPQFTKIIPDEEAIKAHIENLKDTKAIREQDINGLKIFLETKW